MAALHDATLAQLLDRAQTSGLLKEHRFVDQFLYLDLGVHRFIFDKRMGRTFLMGLLAGQAQPQAVPAQAA